MRSAGRQAARLADRQAGWPLTCVMRHLNVVNAWLHCSAVKFVVLLQVTRSVLYRS